MRNIPMKKMIELWDRLLWLEKASDYELAKKTGLSYGTVGAWRSANPPKGVRLSTLGQIEEKLGLEINLKANEQWEVRRLHEGRTSTPNEIYFSMPGNITQEEKELYQELLKRLVTVAPGDFEKIIEMIDVMFKKKS